MTHHFRDFAEAPLWLEDGPRGLVVDFFAGGGGASTGIEWALGRAPDIAINHDAEALALHSANHPGTLHLCENVFQVDPAFVCGKKGVDVAWFSPDCKHFSKAKGGALLDKSIRGLAWVAMKWIGRGGLGYPHRGPWAPKIFFLENVEEFCTWGPLNNGKPDKKRRGLYFRRFVKMLRAFGYVVEWREMRACDFGAPTIRKRLFLIARCDGLPIVWPEATHGARKSLGVTSGKLKPWRTAADSVIDWTLPCHSIFLTKGQARKLGIKRPLADATLDRIYAGIDRFLFKCEEPFIVNLTGHGGWQYDTAAELVVPIMSHAQHGGSVRDGGEPTATFTASPKDQNHLVTPFLARVAHGERDKNGKKRGRGEHNSTEPLPTVLGSPEFSVIAPTLVGVGGRAGQSRPRSAGETMATGTAKADTVLIVPTLVQTGYGERVGQAPRALDPHKPLGTAVAGGVKHALAAAHITKFRANSIGSAADEPGPTVTANSFIKRPGGAPPLGLVMAYLAQHNNHGTGDPNAGRAADAPISTLLQSGSHQNLVHVHMLDMHGSDMRSAAADDPLLALTAQGLHAAQVAAFMIKYHKSGGQWASPADPAHTIDTTDRYGLITVTIQGEPYIIVDIGMRMLIARELFRAQGFPDSYKIDVEYEAKIVRKRGGRTFTVIQKKTLTKTAQIRMCGNSVCPPMAEALLRANAGMYANDNAERVAA